MDGLIKSLEDNFVKLEKDMEHSKGSIKKLLLVNLKLDEILNSNKMLGDRGRLHFVEDYITPSSAATKIIKPMAIDLKMKTLTTTPKFKSQVETQ